MCTIRGFKKGAPGPYAYSGYIKKGPLYFARAMQKCYLLKAG